MSTADCFVAFLFGIALGFFIMANAISATPDYKKQAIERGFAKYSETTGEWEWKEEEP